MKVFTVIALALAVGLAGAASPFASSSPDGLERVAGDTGFLERGRQHETPASDYALPGVGDPRLATGLAGFAGTLVVFGFGSTVAMVARRRPVAA
jgi:hypothetical protein